MPSVATDPPRLPWRVKLGYGSAELGITAVEFFLQIYLLKFYHDALGLAAPLAGLALAVAMIWDAVSDPLMGGLSDRCSHRAGRRRPFLLPGAAGLALFFALLFLPPAWTGQAALFSYLLLAYLLLNTAMTVLAVPLAALGGELSFDRDERTEIFGARRLFGTAGVLLGIVLPGLVLQLAGDVPRSRGLAALLLAVPIVATAALATRATRGRDRPAPPTPLPPPAILLRGLLRDQARALGNRVFLPLLGAFVVAGVGRSLNAATALYYYQYRLGLDETTTIFRVLVPFFLSFLLGIGAWVRLSRRAGKKWPAFAGVLSLGLLTAVVYLVLPPGGLAGAVAMAVVGGFLAGAIVLFESLVADVVDHDELRSGRHREGLYFGVWKMGMKLARAGGLVLAGVLLEAIGLGEGSPAVPEGAARGLAWIFGPGVGGLFVAGALVFVCFPLSDDRHRRVQALLKRRQAGR